MTALGNVLRAAEYRAGRLYGLDTVVMWPRLYPLLPAAMRDLVGDLRLQMDVVARFTVTFLAAAAISAALLATHGWWLLVPAGALVLAACSYGATVAAARGLRDVGRGRLRPPSPRPASRPAPLHATGPGG
ncbi:MAG: hypothetical protein ACR2LJ_09245 [Acidimicrobiales bacterium]